MNAEQKYNRIIDFIEEEIAKGLNQKARDILSEIKKEFCIDQRSLSGIFDFLTGMPVVSYIKMRQLMKAAEVVLSGGSNQDAIKYTGFNDESSFIKAFGREFSCSPGNFAERKNVEIKKSITWVDITDSVQKASDKKQTPVQMKFGIPIDTYKKILEAENMQLLYGFDDEASNVAYKIAERFNAEVADAFELVDQLIIMFEDKRPFIDDYDNWIKMCDELIGFYFKLENVSFNNAIDIFAGIKAKGIENLSQEDYERLSENPYVFWEPTYLNTFGYESSQMDSGLDGYEDSFNSYEAYKSYNPYK